MIGKYQIPFDKDGNQQHYGFSWTSNYKDNFVFKGSVEITGMQRGRSAAFFECRVITDLQSFNGTMFMKELFEALKYFKNGVLEGEFCFCKRGQNFGIKFLKEE